MRRDALLLLHPTDADEEAEYHRANALIESCVVTGFPEIIAVYPNNDPGLCGIIRAIEEAKYPPVKSYQNLVREAFLGLMRDAAVVVGNSSSGIIEAASFGTPVVDVGPRQAGERGGNVTSVPFTAAAIGRALAGGVERRAAAALGTRNGTFTAAGIRSLHRAGVGDGEAGRAVAAEVDRVLTGRRRKSLPRFAGSCNLPPHLWRVVQPHARGSL